MSLTTFGAFTIILVLVLIIYYFVISTASGCKDIINGGLAEPPPSIPIELELLRDPTFTVSSADNSTTGSENSTHLDSDTNNTQPTSVEVQPLKDCEIDYKILSKFNPLTFENNNGYTFPNNYQRGKIIIVHNGRGCFACTGPDNYIAHLRTQLAQFSCYDGKIVDDSGNTLDISNLNCNEIPRHTVKRSDSISYRGTHLENIGFTVDTDFVKLIQICLTNTKNVPLWSKYVLVAGIGVKQVDEQRPGFKSENFYSGLNLTTLYSKNKQKATLARLLGSADLANQFISATSEYYLAKGHLAPYADFPFVAQQQATNYYINTAPQWQTFNNGNWSMLENNIRTYAYTNGVNLEVYTGTLGVITFKDIDEYQKEIYLYTDANGNNQIPVPAVFWKIVYDPSTQKGTAFVGINNPYLTKEEVEKDPLYWFGDDVSSQTSWLTKDKDIQKKGICYCLTVEQLRKKVPYLPIFTVKGLLK